MAAIKITAGVEESDALFERVIELPLDTHIITIGRGSGAACASLLDPEAKAFHLNAMANLLADSEANEIAREYFSGNRCSSTFAVVLVDTASTTIRFLNLGIRGSVAIDSEPEVPVPQQRLEPAFDGGSGVTIANGFCVGPNSVVELRVGEEWVGGEFLRVDGGGCGIFDVHGVEEKVSQGDLVARVRPKSVGLEADRKVTFSINSSDPNSMSPACPFFISFCFTSCQAAPGSDAALDALLMDRRMGLLWGLKHEDIVGLFDGSNDNHENFQEWASRKQLRSNKKYFAQESSGEAGWEKEEERALLLGMAASVALNSKLSKHGSSKSTSVKLDFVAYFDRKSHFGSRLIQKYTYDQVSDKVTNMRNAFSGRHQNSSKRARVVPTPKTSALPTQETQFTQREEELTPAEAAAFLAGAFGDGGLLETCEG
jgi:hypothetical protein